MKKFTRSCVRTSRKEFTDTGNVIHNSISYHPGYLITNQNGRQRIPKYKILVIVFLPTDLTSQSTNTSKL